MAAYFYPKKIYKEGSPFNGPASFMFDWQPASAGTDIKAPATGNGDIQYIEGNPEFSPYITDGYSIGPVRSVYYPLKSMTIDGQTYGYNFPNQLYVTGGGGNYQVRMQKDVWLINDVPYFGGYDADIALTFNSTDMPEDVPVILSVNGVDVETSYFSGGVCNLSYTGEAMIYSVRVGNNGKELLSGSLESSTLTKTYNLTSKKVQRNLNDFLIEENSGIATIKNDTSIDIVKANIYS
jgi:hypothetical protein